MPIVKVMDYIENEKFESLSLNVKLAAKKALLDFISSSFAGYRSGTYKRVLNASSWLGANGNCTVIGQTVGTSPLAATFINATLASSMDIDDGHRQAVGHPGCMVIPPALAMGEMMPSCSGNDLLTAIVTGYEVGIRCGIVMNSNYDLLFYGSGGWGHFGSSTSASKIKGLSRNVTMHAVSIGEVYGPTAQCGKSIAAGSMTKESVGWGAVTGLMGVFLAEKGFTGVKNILMDDQLYHSQAKSVFDTLGEMYEIESIYFKEYPACKWAHSPISAARWIKREFNPSLENIDEIIVETFSKAVTLNHISPETSEAAQYSIPFTVAVAFCYGNVEPYHVSEQHITNEAVINVAKKVRLITAQDLEKKFPEKRPVRLIVKMKGGEVYKKEVDTVKGDAENPLDWDELEAKFEMCSKGILIPKRQLEIVKMIKDLEKLPDLKDLTMLLRK